MILTDIVKKFYSCSLEKIKNVETKQEKQECLMELISNLMNANIPFSVRALAKVTEVSRKFVKKVLEIMSSPFLYYFLNIKKETRGRKKVEEKHPEIIHQIKEICDNYENVDKSLQDRIIYLDITLHGIKEKLKENYNYSNKECPCENTIRRILINKLGYKITKIKKVKLTKKSQKLI